MRKRHALSGAVLCIGLPAFAMSGCSDGDSPFSAVTEDETNTSQSLQPTSTDPTFDGGVVDTDAGGPDPGPFPSPPPPGVDGGTTGAAPSGLWHFDDCYPGSTVLVDSSGNGANAQRAKGRTCAPGIKGEAVAFHSRKDIVQIADAPQFTVHQRIAVAAWVQPTTVTGNHPIVLKRLDDQTSFSLGIHDGNAEFSIVLATGRTVRSRAPIDPNVWTHVAGLYDGRFLFLFLNGEQVGQVAARGDVRDVSAPIRIGATTQTQYFDGLIDEVWLSTNPVSANDITALACIQQPSTFALTPATSGPVPPGTAVQYALAVTNHDIGACGAMSYFPAFQSSNPFPPPPPTDGGAFDASASDASVSFDGGTTGPTGPSDDGIHVVASPPFAPSVPPGGSVTFNVTVTSTEDTPLGVHDLPFTIFSSNEAPLSGSLRYELVEPSGCHVSTARELMIRDTSVVDDPNRTSFGGPTSDPRRGAWTFGALVREMAPTPADAPAFVEKLFRTWLTDQTVNGLTIGARPGMQSLVLDPWPRTADGALDLEQAPLRLLSIVNRVDLRDLAQGKAGEGRFVFGVLGPGGQSEEFTIILEYALIAQTADDVLGWANAWHALSSHPFPSEEYNVALEALTRRFTARGAAPARPNGSALDQLRTNEFATVLHWELRQFGIGSTGFLEPRAIDLTPDLSFNQSAKLARFINQNEAAIIAEQSVVPAQFEGAPFLTGSVFNDLIAWTAPGIQNNEARFHLSLNTCNGCHGSTETNTSFLHVSPRIPGQQAPLSPFLVGTTAFDPITRAPRTFNDLARRNTDLKSLVCPTPPPAARNAARVQGSANADFARNVAKGISRVH